jgi:hypothetical protein
MWRACRLVVDTGMHAKGWSRQQAIDFMASNTSLARLDIESEIDRYISWPGQALAYKIGELRILQLRREAEEKLGAKFDSVFSGSRRGPCRSTSSNQEFANGFASGTIRHNRRTQQQRMRTAPEPDSLE